MDQCCRQCKHFEWEMTNLGKVEMFGAEIPVVSKGPMGNCLFPLPVWASSSNNRVYPEDGEDCQCFIPAGENEKSKDRCKMLEAELLRVRTTGHGAAHALDNIAVEQGWGAGLKPNAIANKIRTSLNKKK